MTVLHSPPGREARFTALYVRLVSGLGIVSVGGWVALLLDDRGDRVEAQLVVVGSAMLAAQCAGARAWGFVLLEVTLLVALAIQVPLLVNLWGDFGPLTLIAVAAIQVPFALAATGLSTRRSPQR